eukprot:GHVU01013680.1.p2 GENE.GHVU01013680.1~~GHVU01013680.1.p2  ORF type:complete len:218 (-),score=44.17 GHVU01013680.1:730-1383(-)
MVGCRRGTAAAPRGKAGYRCIRRSKRRRRMWRMRMMSARTRFKQIRLASGRARAAEAVVWRITVISIFFIIIESVLMRGGAEEQERALIPHALPPLTLINKIVQQQHLTMWLIIVGLLLAAATAAVATVTTGIGNCRLAEEWGEEGGARPYNGYDGERSSNFGAAGMSTAAATMLRPDASNYADERLVVKKPPGRLFGGVFESGDSSIIRYNHITLT